MNIKTELWCGHKIRFIEKEINDWWAVAVDVTKALGLSQTTIALKRVEHENQALISIKGITNGNDTTNIVNELGIYVLVLGSKKKQAKEFKRWVFSVLKTLRQSTGLEGFQIFRMLDKDHQKEAMKQLCVGLSNPTKIDFIKANTIANKAVSNLHGYSKMIKKVDMTPEMLKDRQPILEDTVSLMTANNSFNLGLSVSDKVYSKYKKVGNTA